jgi:hypothetical protein
MSDQTSTLERIDFEELEMRAIPMPIESTRAEEKSLSIGEKAAFGVAAVFSTAILVVSVFLTIMGFIFSPMTDTLVFGLLMAATGVTTYVIWKGGKRTKA